MPVGHIGEEEIRNTQASGVRGIWRMRNTEADAIGKVTLVMPRPRRANRKTHQNATKAHHNPSVEVINP
jgi:hypothetical protein